MNYLDEGRFCTWSEYRESEQDRIAAEDLINSEYYNLMLALRANEPDRQAASFPAQVLERKLRRNGLVIIRFSILDQDLNPNGQYDGQFQEAYWQDAPRKITVICGDQKYDTETGYFKAPDDFFDTYELETGETLRLKSEHTAIEFV